MSTDHTDEPFPEETRRLLAEKKLTLRGLAATAGVDKGYLSRALRRREKASLDLIERVTAALELPPDYFHEVRQARVIEYLRSFDDAVNQLYYKNPDIRRLDSDSPHPKRRDS